MRGWLKLRGLRCWGGWASSSLLLLFFCLFCAASIADLIGLGGQRWWLRVSLVLLLGAGRLVFDCRWMDCGSRCSAAIFCGLRALDADSEAVAGLAWKVFVGGFLVSGGFGLCIGLGVVFGVACGVLPDSAGVSFGVKTIAPLAVGFIGCGVPEVWRWRWDIVGVIEKQSLEVFVLRWWFVVVWI